MSRIFPNAYAFFFVAQLAIIMVAYVVLRSKTKLKVLTSVCVSILVTALLTLLLLCLDTCTNIYAIVNYADLQEYVAGTLVAAVPFLLILMVQFIAPLLREFATGQEPAGPERTRILGMIEEGKITAAEGSDLLEAMGRSNAMQGQDSFSRPDIVILCGVALVVMGFFLPWVYVRISMPGMQGMRDIFGQRSAYQAGYHTGALGWTIFVIALVSAVPVFVTPKNFLYKISILHIFLTLVGFLLGLSTLLRARGHMGLGIIVCAAGFTIGLIASGAKFKRLTA